MEERSGRSVSTSSASTKAAEAHFVAGGDARNCKQAAATNIKQSKKGSPSEPSGRAQPNCSVRPDDLRIQEWRSIMNKLLIALALTAALATPALAAIQKAEPRPEHRHVASTFKPEWRGV